MELIPYHKFSGQKFQNKPKTNWLSHQGYIYHQRNYPNSSSNNVFYRCNFGGNPKYKCGATLVQKKDSDQFIQGKKGEGWNGDVHAVHPPDLDLARGFIDEAANSKIMKFRAFMDDDGSCRYVPSSVASIFREKDNRVHGPKISQTNPNQVVEKGGLQSNPRIQHSLNSDTVKKKNPFGNMDLYASLCSSLKPCSRSVTETTLVSSAEEEEDGLQPNKEPGEKVEVDSDEPMSPKRPRRTMGTTRKKAFVNVSISVPEPSQLAPLLECTQMEDEDQGRPDISIETKAEDVIHTEQSQDVVGLEDQKDFCAEEGTFKFTPYSKVWFQKYKTRPKCELLIHEGYSYCRGYKSKGNVQYWRCSFGRRMDCQCYLMEDTSSNTFSPGRLGWNGNLHIIHNPDEDRIRTHLARAVDNKERNRARKRVTEVEAGADSKNNAKNFDDQVKNLLNPGSNTNETTLNTNKQCKEMVDEKQTPASSAASLADPITILENIEANKWTVVTLEAQAQPDSEVTPPKIDQMQNHFGSGRKPSTTPHQGVPVDHKEELSELDESLMEVDVIPITDPFFQRLRVLRTRGFTHRLYLQPSEIHGRGLYTMDQIPKGELIIEYKGDVISHKERDIRAVNYKMQGIEPTFFAALDENTVVDGTSSGNVSKYINHSCDPNCALEAYEFEGGLKTLIIASIRTIFSGEELSYDYAFDYDETEERIKCCCRARNCRGFVDYTLDENPKSSLDSESK